MDEQQWLECDDPLKLLLLLADHATDRKLRLFGVACCRKIWHLLEDRGSRHAVEVSEQYADGEASDFQMVSAYTEAYNAAAASKSSATRVAKWAAARNPGNFFRFVMMCLVPTLQGTSTRTTALLVDAEQVRLLIDIFGNPFKPITFNPAWLTPQVTGIAEGIYQERAWDRMAVLGDALEEAGCAEEQVLQHCRSGTEHVLGCWLIDLLTRRD